jgi:Rieske Fe-S protein
MSGDLDSGQTKRADSGADATTAADGDANERRDGDGGDGGDADDGDGGANERRDGGGGDGDANERRDGDGGDGGDGGDADAPRRRDVLRTLSSIAMAGGLVAGYGTCAAFAGRFLYPARARPTAWQLAARIGDIAPGAALAYQAPDGAPINIARRGAGTAVGDFIALSSTCPHLGCRVHWEPHNERFFCPCHNGVFTPEGEAVSGPPADAGQDLSRYPLRVDGPLIYIQVPMVSAASPTDAAADAPRLVSASRTQREDLPRRSGAGGADGGSNSGSPGGAG